ncbi:unnamed protein product [Cochlearia groenlandica]
MSFEIGSRIFPSNLLFPSNKNSSLDEVDELRTSIVPEKLFLLISRFRFCTSGKLPLSWFLERYNSVNELKLPNSEGIEEMKLFSSMLSLRITGKLPVSSFRERTNSHGDLTGRVIAPYSIRVVTVVAMLGIKLALELRKSLNLARMARNKIGKNGFICVQR